MAVRRHGLAHIVPSPPRADPESRTPNGEKDCRRRRTGRLLRLACNLLTQEHESFSAPDPGPCTNGG
jgi:hypothetical protein